MKTSLAKILFLIFGSAAALIGCSSDDSISTSHLSDSYHGVTWYLECPGTTSTHPQPGPDELVLTGEGPHDIVRARMLNTPITVKGSVCPPMDLKRDIIFVFDVSGSMGSNDGLDSDSSCNRMKAINAVIDNTPADDVSHFAIVTFDDTVQAQSTQFFSTKEELFTDIGNGDPTKATSVICNADGGTVFSSGLNKAKELFQTGREFATKEIFFVSDGQSADGANEAKDLREQGVMVGSHNQLVTIATVMIGSSSDNYLKNEIASKDQNNNPIHAVASNAGSLASILQGMSDNELAGSAIFHGVPTSQTNQIDVFGQLNNYRFTAQPFKIQLDTQQTTYKVDLKFWDTNRNTFTVPGTINWID